MTTNETTNDRVRRNIDVVRGVRKLSAQRIADEAGFGSRQIVQDRLVGRTKITVDELEAFAKVLDIPAEILLRPLDHVFLHLSESGAAQVVIAEIKPPRKPAKRPAKRAANG